MLLTGLVLDSRLGGLSLCHIDVGGTIQVLGDALNSTYASARDLG